MLLSAEVGEEVLWADEDLEAVALEEAAEETWDWEALFDDEEEEAAAEELAFLAAEEI